MALTATNAFGNNTNTKTNYITATAPNQVIVYPSGEKTGYSIPYRGHGHPSGVREL